MELRQGSCAAFLTEKASLAIFKKIRNYLGGCFLFKKSGNFSSIEARLRSNSSAIATKTTEESRKIDIF